MKGRGKARLFWSGLAVLFGLCAWHVARVSFKAEETSDHRRVVRVGHFMLHSGIREALQAVIDEYERRHPDVHVVQVAVPDRAYPQFLRTQLVAGTAPDILQIGAHFTGMDELRARYFEPISAWVEQPNPYNAGTPLAGRRWRDTFLDGLENGEAYSAPLRHYYGIPLAVGGVRILYNTALLREITGGTALPLTYAQLVALCRQVEDYARRSARPVVPFAGSRLSALFLMSPLFASVNQRLYYDLAADHTLRVTDWDYGLTYLQGRWNFDLPSIRLGYALAREMARYQKPGFYQLNTGEATLQFLQGQSVMIVSHVLDVTNLKAQSDFAIDAAQIPALSPDDPVHGAGVLGPVTEIDTKATANLGLVRGAPQHAAAVDFLRFLGSRPGMEIFSARSNWLPSVAGVAVPAWMEPLRPVQAGYAGRFFAEIAGKGDARFVVGNQLHLLFGPAGGVDAFLKVIKQSYGPAMRTDLVKDVRESNFNLRRQEPALLASYLAADAAPIAAGRAEPDGFWREASSQNGYEARMLRTQRILSQTASQP
jgi:raffinose/stachyose/melibiose transport system substrate-binding protein